MNQAQVQFHRGYYMRAAALEPPARASIKALKTSYATFHQFTFFMIMLNHMPFQSLQAGEFDQLPHEPLPARWRTKLVYLHRGLFHLG